MPWWRCRSQEVREGKCGCFLSRQIYKVPLRKRNSLAAAGKAFQQAPSAQIRRSRSPQHQPSALDSQQLHWKSTLQLLSPCGCNAKSCCRREEVPKDLHGVLRASFNQLCSRGRPTSVLPTFQRARHEYRYFPRNPTDGKP